MNDHYYLYASGLAIAFIICLILAFYNYKNRSSTICKYFMLIIGSITIWILGAFFELISDDLSTKIFWGKICYLGVATIAPFLFMFALSYGNYNKYLNKRNIALLMIIPVIIIFLAFTNQWHGLIWPNIYLTSTSLGMFIVYKHGIGVAINIIYSYSLLMASIFILLHILINSPKIYKFQVATILIAILFPFISNILYLSGLFLDPFDFTPLAFFVTALLISISIFKYRLLDILPIAHNLLFENMENAYLVFDHKNRLLEMNSMAEKLFDINYSSIGKSLNDIFPDLTQFCAFLEDKTINNKELILGNNSFKWVYIQKTFIYNPNKSSAGFLVVISDIDVRKRSEIALKESQRRMTTLISNLPGIAYRCKNDKDWTMEFVSEGCLELTGYKASDLINNKKLSYGSLIHPDDIQKVWDDIQLALDKKEPFELVYRIITADSQIKYVWERGRGVFTDSQDLIDLNDVYGCNKNEYGGKDNYNIAVNDLSINNISDSGLDNLNGDLLALEGFISDITNSKKAEDEIRKSLQEKEVLLQEIHHRVKNNMQIISSLLNLQSVYSESKTSDEIFRESQDRVKAMSLVHEKLYRSQSLEKIDFREYISNLVSNLIASYEKRLIDLKMDLEEIYLDINTAIPCGLIINELVTNSIKHAFPENQKGTIIIKFFREGDYLKLVIKDNGIGLPPEFKIESAKSLGLQLVYSLIDQLDGDINMHFDHGAEFEITFSELKYKKRI